MRKFLKSFVIVSLFFACIGSVSADIIVFGKGGVRRRGICMKQSTLPCFIITGIIEVAPDRFEGNFTVYSVNGSILYQGPGSYQGAPSPGMNVNFHDGTTDVIDPACEDCND